MIALRSRRGESIPLPAGAEFVEIQDLEGNAAVVCWRDAEGRIHVTTAGEPDHLRYCRIFRLKSASVADVHVDSGVSR